MAGDRDYQLIPEAFLFHEQNLRKEVLDKMFADAGIPNAWTWVEKYRTIKQFVEKIRGSQNPTEAELKQLIQYRNEAAHGAEVSQILSSQELLDLGEFVTALCEALAELVTYRVVMQQTTTGTAREIGTIGEWFNKPRAAVATLQKVTLSLGNEVFLVNENLAYCKLARIESLKINDISQNEVKIESEQEVGIQFNTDARKGLKMYVRSPPEE